MRVTQRVCLTRLLEHPSHRLDVGAAIANYCQSTFPGSTFRASFQVLKSSEQEAESSNIVYTIADDLSCRFFRCLIRIGFGLEVCVDNGATTPLALHFCLAAFAKVGETGYAALLGDAEPCALLFSV